MIVLDTNLLYALVGIEKPNASLAASLKAVESRHKLAVTTVTVTEAVSKFRQDLSTLRKALLPVRSGRLSLISIGYLPVNNDELEAIWSTADLTAAEKAVRNVQNRKVTQEAAFSRFMMITSLVVTFDTLLRSRMPNDAERSMRVTRDAIVLLEANSELVLREFQAALEEGYAVNAAHKFLKEQFTTLYSCLVWCWFASVHSIQTGTSIGEIQKAPRSVKDAVGKALRQDVLARDLIRADNPFAILSKKTFRSTFITAISTLQQQLLGIIPHIPADMVAYMATRYDKMFSLAGKLSKNDLLDMLVVLALHCPGTRIVTLDSAMREFLLEHHPASAALLKAHKWSWD